MSVHLQTILPVPAAANHTAPAALLDCHSEAVARFVATHLAGVRAGDERESAVRLYYAVRDEIFYEIFNTDLGPSLSADSVAKAGKGFCLHKAILFAAACRSAGLQSRILAAPVRNHVSSPAIHALVGGDVFLHWFNEVRVHGRWLEVAPIFNKLTCKIYGIAPLEFDGMTSATRQPYSNETAMVYLSTPKRFEDPDWRTLVNLVRAYHPRMVTDSGRIPCAEHFSPHRRTGTEEAMDTGQKSKIMTKGRTQ